MFRKSRTSLLIIAMIALLSACGTPQTPDPGTNGSSPAAPSPATESPAAESPAAGNGTTYVLVPKALGNPYFDTANQGAQEAAEELGVTVTYQGPATADATQQIQLINSLIAQGVDGLSVSANDADALVSAGQEALNEGIPVVSWDSAIAEGGRTVHVNQANAEDIGRGQIELVSELIGGEGQIAILSATSTAPNQNEWIEFMEDELTKPEYANLELVATVYGDDEDEKSYNEAQGLMRTYPELKGIISPTTVGIAAAARAVQEGIHGEHLFELCLIAAGGLLRVGGLPDHGRAHRATSADVRATCRGEANLKEER